MTEPRICLWVDETLVDPDNPDHFIPSVVTENEAGHSPLSGDPAKFQRPWSWGPGIERAKALVAEYNAGLGITPDDAVDILGSSMRASFASRR